MRPHAKSHKCPEIAQQQLAAGAVGVCCQKVSEAEAMVNGGIRDILIANEVVGAAKLKSLAALARRATIKVCADDAGNVHDLDAAARAADVEPERTTELIEPPVGRAMSACNCAFDKIVGNSACDSSSVSPDLTVKVWVCSTALLPPRLTPELFTKLFGSSSVL